MWLRDGTYIGVMRDEIWREIRGGKKGGKLKISLFAYCILVETKKSIGGKAYLAWERRWMKKNG
jgi:hypothetical protein